MPKISMQTGIRKSSFPAIFLTMLPIPLRIAPVASIMPKAPPMINRKKITSLDFCRPNVSDLNMSNSLTGFCST